MKKFLIVLLTLAAVASGVFAQNAPSVSWWGWGRFDFLPFVVVAPESGDATQYAGTGVSWGSTPDLEFGLSYAGEKGGVAIDFDGSTAAGVTGNAWIQPMDMLKLTIGWTNNGTLRGSNGGTAFSGGRYAGGGVGDDHVFPRLKTLGGPGFLATLTPMDGLFVGAAILTGLDNREEANKVEEVYKNTQFAAGFTIPNIGLIRAGYFGKSEGLFGDHAVLAAAFKLTAINIVTLDVGVTYDIDEAVHDTELDGKNVFGVGLAANLKLTDMIKVNIGASLWAGGDKDTGGDPAKLEALVNPEFALGFGTVGVEVVFGTQFGVDDSTHFGGDVYVSKGFGPVTLQTGVAFDKKASKGALTVAIPVQFTYSF
jgi:hypothetical protein